MWLGYALTGRVPMTAIAEKYNALNDEERKASVLDVRKFQTQPYTLLACGVPDFLDTFARRLRTPRVHDEQAEVDFTVATQIVFNTFQNSVPHASLGLCANAYTLMEFNETGKGVELRDAIVGIYENYELIAEIVPRAGVVSHLPHSIAMLNDSLFSTYLEVWKMSLNYKSSAVKALKKLEEERQTYKSLYTRLRKREEVMSLPKIELPKIQQYWGLRTTLQDFDVTVKEQLTGRLLKCLSFIAVIKRLKCFGEQILCKSN